MTVTNSEIIEMTLTNVLLPKWPRSFLPPKRPCLSIWFASSRLYYRADIRLLLSRWRSDVLLMTCERCSAKLPWYVHGYNSPNSRQNLLGALHWHEGSSAENKMPSQQALEEAHTRWERGHRWARCSLQPVWYTGALQKHQLRDHRTVECDASGS